MTLKTLIRQYSQCLFVNHRTLDNSSVTNKICVGHALQRQACLLGQYSFIFHLLPSSELFFWSNTPPIHTGSFYSNILSTVELWWHTFYRERNTKDSFLLQIEAVELFCRTYTLEKGERALRLPLGHLLHSPAGPLSLCWGVKVKQQSKGINSYRELSKAELQQAAWPLAIACCTGSTATRASQPEAREPKYQGKNFCFGKQNFCHCCIYCNWPCLWSLVALYNSIQ